MSIPLEVNDVQSFKSERHIRLLDTTLINQIAAGEVIERPASAIKELVENAIDAGATRIDVIVRDGGRTYISVTDNGSGMTLEDLTLCVERHATSKIPDGDLFNIRTMGFRGEALPSIGAVSRLKITTKHALEETAWSLTVEGGQKFPPEPTSFSPGTRIEVRDLFFATPARLKFLKSPSTELSHITDILNRLSMAHEAIHFTLTDGDKTVLNYPSHRDRLTVILGKEFSENSCPVFAEREGLRLTGRTTIPTYNKASSTGQYLFVNDRPVKDKLLSTAVRVAYQDFLASNRYPMMCLFLEVTPEDVDINVHPAKSEVRFRDSNIVRGFIISALRQALQESANNTSTTITESAIASFRSVVPLSQKEVIPLLETPKVSSSAYRPAPSPPQHGLSFAPLPKITAIPTQLHESETVEDFVKPVKEPSYSEEEIYRLGKAACQLHDTYIIAETTDGFIIVDQHAAHERLIYEQMKNDLQIKGIQRQPLLIPEVLSLPSEIRSCLLSNQHELTNFGVIIEPFGLSEILLREVPLILKNVDYKQLLTDLADEINDSQEGLSLKERIHEKMATIACHNSIRSGRKLSLSEMNALLRQMEATPHSGQCNHGRPTYVELKKSDIEKLFGRR
jgi:DNA mismatch repair protein MutL